VINTSSPSLQKTIILPTYNEADNLERLINQILSAHPEFNIIVVDDNSPDGTGTMANILAEGYQTVQIIHRPCKKGLGSAYVEGFGKALAEGADLIFEMDADFSHDPKYLADFLIAAQQADCVIGSRYLQGVRVEGWRFRRLLLSKFANMFASYVMVKPLWDFTSGFRCYHKKVLEAIDLAAIKSDGYAFQIEMTHLTYKSGFSVAEIPILFREREGGYSKISRNIVWEAFWMTLKCRAPLLEMMKRLKYFFTDYHDYIGHIHKDKNQPSS
jgi:dolichol-phosphate mannosyltransferase